ncbi:MAG TPA: Rieske (2Fe-2S) protein [Marmoricola sp.]|jgi:nitrite reductase/ring-hydroxylating ferredoxin subunit|nr:Rieske (2Fe-2S) protein [Marmoricola sp.]
MTDPSRRSVLCGLAAAGLATPLLAACGAGGGGSSTSTGTTGDVLIGTAKVPVGGGALAAEAAVFVTQPEKGTFKAFSAVCTHQSCTVDGAAVDGHIHCSCHGSEFSLTDGSVVHGPATRPLAEVPVRVEGNDVVRA